MSLLIDKLNVLRAAVLMSADSIAAEARSLRAAKTIEEGQVLANLIIEHVSALRKAAEAAGEEEIP